MGSFCTSSECLPLPSRKLHRTGVRVSATTVDEHRATMKAMPNGASIRPSMPVRKKMGRKLAMIINVELRMGIRTSREASKITSTTGRRPGMGNFRLARSLLYTFSTSTMASSTSEPMAMHNPPRLIVLMVRSRACRATMAARRERGIVTREIIVVRAFIRKMNRTTTTKRAPSRRASFTLSILLSMKRDWR